MPWYAYAPSITSICSVLAGLMLAVIHLRRLGRFWRGNLYVLSFVSAAEGGYLAVTGQSPAAFVPAAALVAFMRSSGVSPFPVWRYSPRSHWPLGFSPRRWWQ
jgi:hypothetical protein